MPAWLTDWLTDWLNEWMNEWMNEWIDQLMDEILNDQWLQDEDDGSYGGSSGGFSRVTVELDHLGLVAVGQPAEFTIR